VKTSEGAIPHWVRISNFYLSGEDTDLFWECLAKYRTTPQAQVHMGIERKPRALDRDQNAPFFTPFLKLINFKMPKKARYLTLRPYSPKITHNNS